MPYNHPSMDDIAGYCMIGAVVISAVVFAVLWVWIVVAIICIGNLLLIVVGVGSMLALMLAAIAASCVMWGEQRRNAEGG